MKTHLFYCLPPSGTTSAQISKHFLQKTNFERSKFEKYKIVIMNDNDGAIATNLTDDDDDDEKGIIHCDMLNMQFLI